MLLSKLKNWFRTGLHTSGAFEANEPSAQAPVIRHDQPTESQFPCHFDSLFIKHNGDVFPCCAVWGNPRWRIGSLHDKEIIQKIINFDGDGCRCFWKANRRAYEGELPLIKHLHLELSLKCQAKCAMCCVNAPDWNGDYDFYEELTALVDLLRPKYISVQGGEILVQPRSISWLEKVKSMHQDTVLRLVTNGGAPTGKNLDTIERLFKLVSISFVGFQPETYKTIMGLDVSYTRDLARRIDKTKVILRLKFLVTPLNLHEAAAFFSWAVTICPSAIVFHDSGFHNYVQLDTEDNFWSKIQSRAAKALQRAIISNVSNLIASGTKLHLQENVRKFYDISPEFISENNLSTVFITSLNENME